MAAAINFYGTDGVSPVDVSSSGVGVFASGGFGSPIAVAAWNERSFVCSSNGVTQGPELSNTKYTSLTGVVLGQAGSGILLKAIPNYLAPINVRFTYDSAVRTTNVYAHIYDRNTYTSPASGITTALYEVAHTSVVQDNTGSGGPGTPTVSGQHGWYVFSGGVATSGMQLTSSPGTSGLRPSGSSTTDTRHDHYLALSASPDSIGSKTNWGLWIRLEYL